MEHTKEPWKTGSSPAGKSVIFLIGDEPDHTLGPDENWIDCNTEANARRIVACVNALQGVPTELLENMVRMGITDVTRGNLFSSRVKLQAQRDQLLEALEYIGRFIEPTATDGEAMVRRAKAAIAAVKGE